MTNLWIPDGNKRQTELDIEIASIASHISKIAVDVLVVRRNLIAHEETLAEYEAVIDKLKNQVKIMSLSEYDLLVKNYKRIVESRSFILEDLKKLKKHISDLESRRSVLIILRDKSATKILEFNYSERVKKRSKDRNR